MTADDLVSELGFASAGKFPAGLPESLEVLVGKDSWQQVDVFHVLLMA